MDSAAGVIPPDLAPPPKIAIPSAAPEMAFGDNTSDKKSKKSDKKSAKAAQGPKDDKGGKKDGKTDEKKGEKGPKKPKHYENYSIIASLCNGGKPLNQPKPEKSQEKKTCKQKCGACCQAFKTCIRMCSYLFFCLLLSGIIVFTPIFLSNYKLQKRCYCGVHMFCDNKADKPGHGKCTSCKSI